MRRRDFIGTAAAALLLPGAAVAQQPGRIYRIGFLGIVPRDDPDSAPIYEALFDTLRGQGLIEGENLIVTLRVSRGREDRFGEYAAELASHKVDVIVAVGSAATLAAKRVSSTIPIVMGAVPNPESLGIVTSLARPGGNVTGVSTMLLDIAGKVREISKEAMPNRLRIAFLWNPDNPGSARAIRGRLITDQALGQESAAFAVRNVADLEPAFQEIIRWRAQLIHPHTVLVPYRKQILEFAAREHIPVVFTLREWVRAGAILSYGPDFRDTFRRVALYVAKILHGADPAEMPIEQPTKFELVINLKTAKALGITIPPTLLARADEVIE